MRCHGNGVNICQKNNEIWWIFDCYIFFSTDMLAIKLFIN